MFRSENVSTKRLQKCQEMTSAASTRIRTPDLYWRSALEPATWLWNYERKNVFTENVSLLLRWTQPRREVNTKSMSNNLRLIQCLSWRTLFVTCTSVFRSQAVNGPVLGCIDSSINESGRIVQHFRDLHALHSDVSLQIPNYGKKYYKINLNVTFLIFDFRLTFVETFVKTSSKNDKYVFQIRNFRRRIELVSILASNGASPKRDSWEKSSVWSLKTASGVDLQNRFIFQNMVQN